MGSQDKGTQGLWLIGLSHLGKLRCLYNSEFGGPDWLGIAIQGLGGQNRIQEFRLLEFRV